MTSRNSAGSLTAGGWGAHDRARREDTYDRNANVAFAYVHDHSRLAYSETLPDEKSTTLAA